MVNAYEEHQYFRQRWLMALFALLFLVNLYALVKQLFLGVPVGNNPAPDGVVLFSFFFFLLLLILLFSAHLDLKIDQEGISFRYFPFVLRWRTFEWKDIEELELKKIRPLQDMGGWGLRPVAGGGIGYTVRGNKVIRILLKKGKIRYLGISDIERVREALQRYAPLKRESASTE